MHTPPVITEIWLIADNLSFDDLFYSVLVGLLACCQKSELGSHSTVMLSLRKRKEKLLVRPLLMPRKSRQQHEHTTSSQPISATGNTPLAQWTTKAQSTLAQPKKSSLFLNPLIIWSSTLSSFMRRDMWWVWICLLLNFVMITSMWTSIFKCYGSQLLGILKSRALFIAMQLMLLRTIISMLQ